MLKRLVPIILVVLLLHVANARLVAASAQAGQGGRTVEKVKAGVAKRVGKKSRVTVKLQDGTKLKGSITQAGEASFTLTDVKTGQSRTLAYSDVTQVKGSGLSLTAKILIGVGIGFGVLVILFLVGRATFDPIGVGIGGGL